MVKREPVKVTVSGITLGKPKGDVVKGSGAWRYPNNVIQRAPSTVLNGTPGYTDDKDPGEPRRRHESNFFITLNTNRYVGERMEGALSQLGKDACVQALDALSRDDALCSYIKFGPKSAHYRNDKFADVITKIEWKAAVEVGETLQRLHCHIWLTLHHYSQVQVNMPVMQQMFKQLYNAGVGQRESLRVRKNPYIQVKLLPSSDWAMVMKQYIHKGMREAAL